MQDFKEYLIKEYNVKGSKAIKLSFIHNQIVKKDIKSKIPRINDIITVKLKFVDENLNTILSPSIVFENNIIPKSKEKSLINISPKELNNKFNKAKPDIVI